MGELAPRTLFQIISFSANIGASSTSSRFIFIEALAPQACAPFFSATIDSGCDCMITLQVGCFTERVIHWHRGSTDSQSGREQQSGDDAATSDHRFRWI